jgi:hypothetical protein
MKQPATSMPMDFLNRMVSKARGVESPIAPRLRSLFEPVSAVPASTAAEMEEMASPIAEREPQDAGPAPLAQPGPAAHEPRLPTLHPVEFPEHGNEPAPGKNASSAVEDAAAQVASLRPVPVALHMTNVVAPRQGEHVPLSPPEADVEARADRRVYAAVHDLAWQPPEPPALLPAASRIVRHDEADLARQRQREFDLPKDMLKRLVEEAGALLPGPVTMQMPRLAVPEGSRAERSLVGGVETATSPQGQPAPVINVTIGRVEVRAVQGSPARPRGEPAKPKALSLDDYLKQRGSR